MRTMSDEQIKRIRQIILSRISGKSRGVVMQRLNCYNNEVKKKEDAFILFLKESNESVRYLPEVFNSITDLRVNNGEGKLMSSLDKYLVYLKKEEAERVAKRFSKFKINDYAAVLRTYLENNKIDDHHQKRIIDQYVKRVLGPIAPSVIESAKIALKNTFSKREISKEVFDVAVLVFSTQKIKLTL